MKSIIKDFQVYRTCPEIRRHIRRMYAAKLASAITMVLCSPFILVGAICICIVHVFDFIGQYALLLPHKATVWLHDHQRNLIRTAHSELSLEEIQSRLPAKYQDDEPEIYGDI